jgi:putative membrane protein
MKTILRSLLLSSSLLASAPALLAADTVPADTWHPQSLGMAIGYLLIFVAIGVAAAIISYKVFDKCTPGNLQKEIIEHKNVAAAIIGAAVILGVCIIIAAAMVG